MTMGRPRKTKAQYLKEYKWVLEELSLGIPMRTISKKHKVGLSTVMRLKKRFGAKIFLGLTGHSGAL